MVITGRTIKGQATRMTTKDSFLTDPTVAKVSKWIADRFCPSSGWEHSYVDRRTGAPWSCRGLADAFEQYRWRDKPWPETKKELDCFQRDLRGAVEQSCTERVVEVCEQVLRWGGVAAHNLPYLMSRKPVIVSELRHLRAVLDRDCIPLRSDMLMDRDGSKECRMNAGFVKIYSLLCDDCVMYDGRVGAALGFLVRQFCEETKRSTVPRSLAFAFGSPKESRNPENPKVRNPTRGSLRFPRLRPDSRFHTEQVMRANWLLRHTLEENPGTFSKGRDGLQELAAGLFMVGYDLGPVDRAVQRAASAARNRHQSR